VRSPTLHSAGRWPAQRRCRAHASGGSGGRQRPLKSADAPSPTRSTSKGHHSPPPRHRQAPVKSVPQEDPLAAQRPRGSRHERAFVGDRLAGFWAPLAPTVVRALGLDRVVVRCSSSAGRSGLSPPGVFERLGGVVGAVEMVQGRQVPRIDADLPIIRSVGRSPPCHPHFSKGLTGVTRARRLPALPVRRRCSAVSARGRRCRRSRRCPARSRARWERRP
jgi:hypothetical protein